MSSTEPSSSSPPSSSPSGPLVPQPSRPTPSGFGNQNNFPPGTGPALTSSAGLYLYTFLATLVLLLLVSATIIFRSWALRRHQRALIAEAIANGTYVPPGKAADLGDRPKMYEVFIGDEDALTEKMREEGRFSSEKEKQREKENVAGGSLVVEWDNMVPISGVHLNAPEKPTSPPLPPPAPTPPPPSRFRWLRWLKVRRTRSQPPILPTVAPSEPPSPTTTTRARPFSWQSARTSHSATLTLVSEKLPMTPEPPPEMVRVAVLISMPFADAGRRRGRAGADDAEPELPYMELGVVELGADGLADGMEEAAPSVPPTPGLSMSMTRSHSNSRLPQFGRSQSRVAGTDAGGRSAAVS
ncbi:hypothetical protein C8Q80DRAFT_181433 [Daedaleopsis nitida]|nr:hypothetical protein C8Q80DRAFT_181433 [Daedaleopsis nitida]